MPIRDEQTRKKNREQLRLLNESSYDREAIIASEHCLRSRRKEPFILRSLSTLIMAVIFIFQVIFMRIWIVFSWIQETSILGKMLS